MLAKKILPGNKSSLISTTPTPHQPPELKLLNPVARKPAHYRVELLLSMSPKTGVKCGGFAVYRRGVGPELESWGDLEDYIHAAEKETEYVDHPIHIEYFNQAQGRWLSWAAKRLLELFDKYGCKADIAIKSPRLNISKYIPMEDVSAGRSSPVVLFKVMWDIDRLLDRGFRWDPALKNIHRGKTKVTVENEPDSR